MLVLVQQQQNNSLKNESKQNQRPMSMYVHTSICCVDGTVVVCIIYIRQILQLQMLYKGERSNARYMYT